MTTSDELVDRVARLYKEKWGVSDRWLAREAIAVALEEAAKMAIDIDDPKPNPEWPEEYRRGFETGAADAGLVIAAAIRALIKKADD